MSEKQPEYSGVAIAMQKTKTFILAWAEQNWSIFYKKKKERNALRIADSSKQERIINLRLMVPTKHLIEFKKKNKYYYLLDLILFQLLFPKMIN